LFLDFGEADYDQSETFAYLFAGSWPLCRHQLNTDKAEVVLGAPLGAGPKAIAPKFGDRNELSMVMLRLLIVGSLLALAGCDTTSWGVSQPTGGVMAVPCSTLTESPASTKGMNQSQRDAAEAAPAPMC